MRSRSLDEMEEDLKKIHPLIKPFLIVGTVLAGILLLPFLLLRVAKESDRAEEGEENE